MSDLTRWLETAVAWRCASILFQSPTPEAHRDLVALVSELAAAGGEAVGRLAAVGFEEWAAEYHRVLGPGACPASESSYDDNALAGRGPLLAGISGFYEAFAFKPADAEEVPDHISVELAFLAYLALKVAFASHQERSVEREIAEDAYRSFLDEHPRYWLGRLHERVAASGSEFYGTAADWVLELAAEGRS